jgi:hypothetical protein
LAAKRKRGCAHLDNHTTEEREDLIKVRKTLLSKKVLEGQLRALWEMKRET